MPFGGMQAQSLPPQQPGCVSTAPGLGLLEGSPHLTHKAEGKTTPSLYPWAFINYASSHWSQKQSCTGDRACIAQMCSVLPVIPLCYSKLWMPLFPMRCKGMLINWCSSVCFSFLQHIMEAHLKINKFQRQNKPFSPLPKAERFPPRKVNTDKKNGVDLVSDFKCITGHSKRSLFLGTSCLQKIQFALHLTLM